MNLDCANWSRCWFSTSTAFRSRSWSGRPAAQLGEGNSGVCTKGVELPGAIRPRTHCASSQVRTLKCTGALLFTASRWFKTQPEPSTTTAHKPTMTPALAKLNLACSSIRPPQTPGTHKKSRDPQAAFSITHQGPCHTRQRQPSQITGHGDPCLHQYEHRKQK